MTRTAEERLRDMSKDPGLVDQVIAAAHRAGQEAMRERAAVRLDEEDAEEHWGTPSEFAAVVRALPIKDPISDPAPATGAKEDE